MFAIARIKKHKRRDLQKIQGHNMREHDVKNRDPNGFFKRLRGDENLTIAQLLDEKLKSIGMQTVRKDATLVVELMLTASPEYFRPDSPETWGAYDDDRLKKWVDCCNEFLNKMYGDNVIEATLHCDECTPHLHVSIVPVISKTKQKRRTREQIKNNDPGEKYDTITLSAKEMFSRGNLVVLQDEYALSCAKIGLQRGIRKSKGTHTTIKKYYGFVNQQISSIKNVLSDFKLPDKKPPVIGREKWFDEIKKSVSNETKKLTKKIKDLTLLANDYKRRWELAQKKLDAFVGKYGSMSNVEKMIGHSESELKNAKLKLKSKDKFIFEQQKEIMKKELKNTSINIENDTLIADKNHLLSENKQLIDDNKYLNMLLDNQLENDESLTLKK